jgi:NAD dependent epimerase/dehydratase family enzyme
MPALMVKILFGQMGEELLLQGRQVIPRKVQDSGFNFQYPLLQQALSNLLANKK